MISWLFSVCIWKGHITALESVSLVVCFQICAISTPRRNMKTFLLWFLGELLFFLVSFVILFKIPILNYNQITFSQFGPLAMLWRYEKKKNLRTKTLFIFCLCGILHRFLMQTNQGKTNSINVCIYAWNLLPEHRDFSQF